MSTSVNNYKIYCNDENSYITCWDTIPPTQCPNNNTHSVNVDSVQLISTVDSHEVTVKEDKITISRNTRIIQIPLVNAAPGETVTVDFTFPINMSLYLFDYITSSDNILDEISILANPDTVLGLIVSDIEIGDTTFVAPPALIAYAALGFYLTIFDGTNSNDIGIITNIDPLTSIVTVDVPTTYAFSASNTLVSMTLKVMDKLVIGQQGIHTYGEKIIGGAAIPKGTLTRYLYKNNAVSGPSKSLYLHLTCLY